MAYQLGGTLRTRPPEETLKLIAPMIVRAGITRIAKLTHLDCLGIPVYTCIRPLSKNLATSQGKGISDDLAKCSAYMEGIECFFAESVQTDHYQEQACDPLPLPIIPLNLLPPGAFYTSSMERHIHEWSEMKSILSGKMALIPTNFIRFDLSRPVFENAFFRKTTTGLASGNTEQEAICHGLFEIIERRAKYHFDQLPPSEKRARALDLKTIHYEPARILIELLLSHDLELSIFDMTDSFGYPSISCVIGDKNPFRRLGHYAGAGTHADPGIAICRAITEAIQSRLTYIAGSRDDILPSEYRAHFSPIYTEGKRSFEALIPQSAENISLAYDGLLSRFDELNYDVYCHIHNSCEDPVSVVKCFVPGISL